MRQWFNEKFIIRSRKSVCENFVGLVKLIVLESDTRYVDLA